MPDSTEAEAARDAYSLDIEQGVSTLYRSSKARVKALVERFDPDLQMAGYMVLRYVMTHEPIRAGDIAAGLTMDKSAVSRQLTVLREKGLIELHADPDDGRASLVRPSESAKTALETFRGELKADYQRILGTWEAEDIESFARLLRRFNESR
jgi:DNA-binding MarR family transcriptional regulator